jgi:hypothetical protein
LPYAIDYALSELITSSDHDWALPYAIDYALSGLSGLSGLGLTFFDILIYRFTNSPQAQYPFACPAEAASRSNPVSRDAMHRVSTAQSDRFDRPDRVNKKTPLTGSIDHCQGSAQHPVSGL